MIEQHQLSNHERVQKALFRMEDAHEKVMEKKRVMMTKINSKYKYAPTLYQITKEKEIPIKFKHLNPMGIKPKSPVEKVHEPLDLVLRL